MNAIGQRIKYLRKQKKITQTDFSQKIGISRFHLSNIERGTRILTERSINDICRVYKINKEWLINGTGEMYKNELEGLDIKDNEIKRFMELYLKADEKTQKYILGIIENSLEFIENKKQ